MISLVTITVIEESMAIKLGSIIIVLMMFFFAKISFETAMGDKAPTYNDRSPASIDQSYHDHLNNR